MSMSDKDLHGIYNQGMQHSHMAGLQAVWNYAQNWVHAEAFLKKVAATPPPPLVIPSELVAARDKAPPPSAAASISSFATEVGTPIPMTNTAAASTAPMTGPVRGDEAMFYPNLSPTPGQPPVGPFPSTIDLVRTDTVDLTVIRPNKPNVLVTYVPIGQRATGMYCTITPKA